MADKVRKLLRAAWFEPYESVARSTSRSPWEDIRKNLERAEYFLFIDTIREGLVSSSTTTVDGERFRGSLYSHQELAIALMVGCRPVVLQQRGLDARDGMLGSSLVRPEPFEALDDVVGIVTRLINKKTLRTGWRNTLEGELIHEGRDALLVRELGAYARYWHGKVCNNSIYRWARNAAVYLVRIEDTATGEVRFPETVESKWRGSSLPYVRIPPTSHRPFDLVARLGPGPDDDQRWDLPCSRESNLAFVPRLTDSGPMLEFLQGPGTFLLTYRLVDSAFPTSEWTFQVDLGPCPKDMEVVAVGE